jgi:hypothetical protein
MLRNIGWSILIATGTIFLTCSVRAQVGVSLPLEQHRTLDLLRSNQPGFEIAVDVQFPGLHKLDGFQAIKPFLAMLHNMSGHGIKGYVVRWVIVGANGSTHELNGTFWAGTGGPEVLSGQEIVWKPGEFRLVSPLFNWGVSSLDVQSRANLLSALVKDSLATDATNALSIDIFIDAVVYDDGIFSGPDSEDFYDRYECERNGALDEGIAVLNLIDRNASEDEIVTQLKTAIEKGQEKDGTDRTSLLEAARGREAQTLLGVFNQGGRIALRNLVQRVVSYNRTTLRRL